MPKKKRKQPSAQQQKKSTQERREARQKRVQQVFALVVASLVTGYCIRERAIANPD